YKFRNLIKPLREGGVPVELLPREKFFWMESKDLEGYPGHFYIGYIIEPRTLHPIDEKLAVKHPYDELLIFAGTNSEDILDLGAEVSAVIGEEGEEHVITEPSVLIVPKNVPHGPIKIGKIKRPIIHVALCDAPEYRAEFKKRDIRMQGTKYSKLVKRLTTSKTAYEGYLKEGPITIDERGVMDLRAIGPGEAYQIVQMHPEDLEGVNISFSWEFFKTTGVWMSTKLAHVHPEPELLIAIGLDPNNIYNLGASIEFWFGSEREVYVIDKPVAITIPRPWIPHTPVVTQRVDRPFAFMLICPGRYTRAGYVETGWDV
ncbi:MAG: hypothetical protein QXE14_03515, partial [Candidatus Bathyarchaeia archaeon]